MEFQAALALFRGEEISHLAETSSGRRFLKLRSLARKQHLERLFEEVRITPRSTKAADMLQEAFEALIPERALDRVIRLIDAEERRHRAENVEALVDELYKLDTFNWGGLHQNSLERAIVDNYVKKIWRHDILEERIEGELHASLRGYVLCSWYNHWTSILIEDIFRDHRSVLPAVGRVKKIDFFVNETPFDLKVTYLPEGFIAQRRRDDGLRPEMTLLKHEARRQDIRFDAQLPAGRLLENLWKKIEDSPEAESIRLIEDLRHYREALVAGVEGQPHELIRWLYENQGVRRFDAANRLFLILVDARDYFASWKLKRALPLLRKCIRDYLDEADVRVGSDVSFRWQGRHYSATSDVIVVRRAEL